MKIINLLRILPLLGLFFISCNDEEANNTGKAKINFDLSGEVIQGGQHLLLHDEKDPNNKYIRIDSSIIYGFGITYLIPDSLKDIDLKLILNGKMRESDNYNGSIAVSITSDKDSLLYWAQFSSEKYIKQLNSWGEFNDSAIVPKTINNHTAKILKVFPFKNRGKGTFDVDELVIDLTQ